MSSMAKVCRSLSRSSAHILRRERCNGFPLSPLAASSSISSFKSRSFSSTMTSYSGNSGNKEVFDFLKEEIAAEKNNQKAQPTLKDFRVEQDGSELKLSRTFESERIEITLNVNHTVDSAVPDDGSQEAPEMKSKPNFEVDLIKENGKRVLSFSCSYVPDTEMESTVSQSESQLDDVFAIDEVTFSTSLEHKESNYAVAGDILDGYLYDLFMNMLDERGINGGFAEDLSTYCSAYEHSLYIRMLENVQDFVKSS
uniref:Complement component 1 Q subcomponent-binding protein, mitochondrial n=1 Tax=Lepeophtheirus salmonis TaxID=72036 RepID=A0A0K2TXM2_LEPSM